ncbi:sigma-70 family RNA polymerase sigma factor [Selenomonas sp. AB3002]|uniref:RNA polymerase sigma factor n=1 Tax=Selenomonas sp. AB3002 TaxID=1392502 RepID=UPI000691911A
MNNEFSEVCRTCFRPIYNYVYARVLRRETAEDITQDSFAYALAHWGNYDAARGSHLAYLYRIAASRLADHFRKAYLQREVPAEDVLEIADGAAAAFPPAGDDTLKNPVNRQVENILQRLTDKEREFLSLRYGMELSNPEIAALLGISEKAVSERYRRLLAKCCRIQKEG